MSVFSDASSSDSVDSFHSIFSAPGDFEKAASPKVTVLDLRPMNMYAAAHIRDSRNVAVSLAPDDFFGDAKAVEQRWMELRAALESEACTWSSPRKVLLLCADGDSSRMAAAILRAKGFEALCVDGGFPALVE